MGILGAIFGRSKTIDDVALDDLRDEKVRLEVNEQSLSRRLRQLEGERQKAFNNAVSSSGSKVDDRIAARQIKAVGAKANDVEREASDTSLKILALDRLIRAKERRNELETKDLWSTISKLPIEELGDSLIEINVSDQVQRNRISEINHILGVDDETLASEESPEIQAIMDQIEMARANGNGDNGVEALRD